MTDKWTIGSSNEGLYNGVRPPEKKKKRKRKKKTGEKKKKHQEITTVASGKIQPKRKHLI